MIRLQNPRPILHNPIQAATKKGMAWLKRWGAHMAAAFVDGKYRITPEGVIVFDDKLITGQFRHMVPGRDRDWTFDKNRIVDQGIMKALGVMFYTDTKIASWYLAPFTGATDPVAGLLASNFTSTQAEVTSTTEGYTEATRPLYVPSAPAANVINNYASEATFTIATASSVVWTGFGLLSSNVRGGTAGTLWSAALFDDARELFNAEPFKGGYQLSLTN